MFRRACAIIELCYTPTLTRNPFWTIGNNMVSVGPRKSTRVHRYCNRGPFRTRSRRAGNLDHARTDERYNNNNYQLHIKLPSLLPTDNRARCVIVIIVFIVVVVILNSLWAFGVDPTPDFCNFTWKKNKEIEHFTYALTYTYMCGKYQWPDWWVVIPKRQPAKRYFDFDIESVQ